MRAMPRTWPSIRLKRLAQDALMSLRMRAIYPHRVSVATPRGTAHGARERLDADWLLLGHRPSGCGGGRCLDARPFPSRWRRSIAGEVAAPAGRHDLYLPHASADPAGRPRCLPDLRHGAGAGIGHSRSRAEPRAGGHDAPVLDRPRAHASRSLAPNGRPPPPSPHAARPQLVGLATIYSPHAA